MDKLTLQEFLKDASPLCKKVEYYNYSTNDYIEPEWLKRERIKLSLEAMTEFILDDSIGTRFLDGWCTKSQLFLQLNPHPWMSYYESWGRGVWVQDLGTLQYKPAYEALREVWIHDKVLSEVALDSLAKLKDKRTIEDISSRLKQPDTIMNEHAITSYLGALDEIGTDATIPVIMELTEELRWLYKGKLIDRSESDTDGRYNLTELSSTIRAVMISLHLLGTRKAKEAMLQVVNWFPEDGMVVSAYRDCTDSRKSANCNDSLVRLPKYELAGSANPNPVF